MLKSLNRVSFLLAFFVSIPVVVFAFINGQNISDLVGQSVNNDGVTPEYTVYDTNDGANNVGFSFSNSHVEVDNVNHRLFVADSNNNRILVHNLDVSNHLTDNIADLVLGQTTMYASLPGTTNSTLSNPTGLAYDSVNNLLYVSDTGNHRILVYNVATITNGEAAVNVIGQANFTTGTSGLTASKLNNPAGIFYENSPGRSYLYVADRSNNRVLIFDTTGITDGEAAVNVIGQANFTTGTASYTQAGLVSPYDVDHDATGFRLFVLGESASQNRVTVYDSTTFADGEAAVNVIGKPDYTTLNGVITQSNLSASRVFDYDEGSNRLFVGGQARVIIFDVSTITDGENAVNLLGQTLYTGSAFGAANMQLGFVYGVYLDTTTNYLYVTDSNNRVGVFDMTVIVDTEPVIDILGQTQNNDGVTDQYSISNTNDSPGPNGFWFGTGSGPGSIAVDTVNHRMFVPDRGNHRVLIFNLDANNNLIDKNADFVLGQANLYLGTQLFSTNNLSGPRGVAYDNVNQRLFVADTGRNRVLVYDMTTIVNDEAPVFVLGQPNFTTTTTGTTQAKFNAPIGLAYATSTGQLFVADTSNNRVMVFSVGGAIVNGQNAVNVLGQANFTTGTTATTQSGLSAPVSIAVDEVGNRLFIGDRANRRVMIHNTLTLTDGRNADVVLGQTNFTANNSISSQGGFYNAVHGITYDSLRKHLYVSNGPRVLVHNVANPTTGQNAYRILTQASFTNQTGSASQVTNIENGALLFVQESGRLYVVDSGANRLTIFDNYLNVEFNKSVATTTSESALGTAYPLLLLVNGVSTSTQTVNIYRTGGTAGGSDFTYATHTIAIPAGIYDGSTSTAITINQPTLIDDGVVESTETIIFGISSSSPYVFAENADGLASTTLTFTLNILDDDVASTVNVELSSASASSVNESAAANFPVLLINGTLTATSSVQFVIGGGTATSGGVDFTQSATTTISIPPGVYNGLLGTAISITTPVLVNDSIDESNETITYSLVNPNGVNIADANLDAATTSAHTYTITDDDTAGVTINVTDNLTGEDGATGAFTIVLTSQPTANVTIPFTSTDLLEGTVGASVTFTTANWNTPQTVTVTGVDDLISDGAIVYSITTGNITSVDTIYGAITGASISDPSFTNQDNDAPGVIITPATTTTTEAGGSATFQITLLSQPGGGADVTVPISISDVTEGTTVTTTITILNANWNNGAANTFTVTGVDDSIADGNISYTVITGDPTSTDLTYDGLTDASVADITMTNTDNEVPGFTITESSGSTSVSEPSTLDTFTVVLNVQPATDVALSVSSLDTTEGSVSPSTLTFTTVNWNIPQTVTLTSVDDSTVDGTQNYLLSIVVDTGSSDAQFASVASQSVSASTLDDDTVVTPTVTPTTSSSGGGLVIPVVQYYSNGTYIQGTRTDDLIDLIGGGEPNVPPEFSNYVCKRYLREYITFGGKNNPEEVKKLQQFLNEYEGEKLAVDGTYDTDDLEAVKRFQAKYLDQIMAPWGVYEPTGKVFRTTTAKINLLMCSKQRSCPYFKSYLKEGDENIEAVMIQDFLNIIFAPISGYPTNGLELSKEFNGKTKTTVKDFQTVYKEIVLKPWGLTSATGWWYKTTRHAANKLMNCAEGEIVLDNGAKVE